MRKTGHLLEKKQRHSWTINISIYIIFAKGLTHDFGKKQKENVIKLGLEIMF